MRKVAAELAARGYLNERGQPYAAKSIAAMVGSGDETRWLLDKKGMMLCDKLLST